MKKWKVLVLFVSIISLLAACSSNGGSSSGDSSGNMSNTGGSDEASSDKVVTITESDYFTDDRRSNKMNAIIKKFEESHPGIKIERTPVPYTEHFPKMLRQAQTDSLPTMVLIDNLNLPALVAAGGVAPISKFGEVDQSKYFEGTMNTVTYEGKLYGLPFGSNDLALFYNKTMLEKAGVKPPETWDQLVSAAVKLHHGDTYGIAFSAPANNQLTWQFSPFMWTNGGSFLKFDSPETIAAISLWNELVEKGGASPSVVNFSQNKVYKEFAAGRAAMMVMGPWKLPSLKETDIDFGIIPIPGRTKDQKEISPIGGEDLAITTSATPEQQKAAWTFIKWLQDPERLPQLDKFFGYIPAYKPAYDKFLKENPDFKVFAKILQNAQALTAKTGAHYAEVGKEIAAGVQKVLTGSLSPEKAAENIQSDIDKILEK